MTNYIAGDNYKKCLVQVLQDETAVGGPDI